MSPIITTQEAKKYKLDAVLPQDNNVIISTSRLTKVFKDVIAVNDLHLQVMRGDVFGFLGVNGSGKTTTIRMLLGLIRPTAGRAVIFGMDTAYQLPNILPHVGAIIETPVFYPYLSGIENLRVVAAASSMRSGKPSERRIDEILDLVELSAHALKAYRHYSLGMKQRMGIAAALLADPDLIMLDEPTNGLDPVGMLEIRQLILRLAELGKTIFISSHILHEIQQVCNRVAILHKGNLITQGEVKELVRQGEQIVVRMTTFSETYQALECLQYARQQEATWITHTAIDIDGQDLPTLRLNAPLARSAEVNALLARHNLFAAEIRPYTISLEEIFLELTTSSEARDTPHIAELANGDISQDISDMPKIPTNGRNV